MTDPIEGVLFTDGRSRVFFHPPRSYSDSDDSHGFHHQVDIVSGPFQGSIDACSYAGLGVLAEFRQQLMSLYENLNGEAHLPASYSYISMSLKGDGLGHITVAGKVAAGDLTDAQLSFRFVVDQTQLSDVIKAIGRFLR